jgi:hypothetical protein
MREILHRSGATLEERADGMYTYVLSSDLAEFLQRDRVIITFRKRTAQKNGVELASPGSWFHDQLLRFARDRGCIAEGYLSVRKDLDREAVMRARRRGFLTLGDLRERRYGTLFMFTFRLSYYSEPAEEEVCHVVFDYERGRVVKRPIVKKLFQPGTDGPEGAFADPPKVNVKTAFEAAWETVQDEVEARVHAMQREGRPLFEKKIETVENYYRQLLAEEKRLQKSRSSKRGQDESRDKIDLLKLEWERRVKEETERLKPQVMATLCTVARVWVPLECWRCSVEVKEGEAEKYLWLDLARAEVWEANSTAPGNGKRC